MGAKINYGKIKLEKAEYRLEDLTEEQAKAKGKIFHDSWIDYRKMQKEKEIKKAVREAKKRKREREKEIKGQ